MAKRTISARGVVVDFDELLIKQQLADGGKFDVVQIDLRQKFIDDRLRRKSPRANNINEMQQQQLTNLQKVNEVQKVNDVVTPSVDSVVEESVEEIIEITSNRKTKKPE